MSRSAARSNIEIFLIRSGIFLKLKDSTELLKICKQSTKRRAESQAIIAGKKKVFLACFEKKFYFEFALETQGHFHTFFTHLTEALCETVTMKT